MRWRDEPAPKWGDWRERSEFLLLPRTIGGETRWLEWDVLAGNGWEPYGTARFDGPYAAAFVTMVADLYANPTEQGEE